MRLVLYPTSVFVLVFLLQIFFIIITERKQKNKQNEADKENGCKNKKQ